MSDEMNRKKAPRINWRPHWSVNTVRRVWAVALSAFKILAGAFVTVLLIGVVCGFVFVGILGDYLQEDILPMAGMNIDDVEMDKNSTMYYVDENGDIQVYQNIFATTSSKWADLEDIPKDLIHAAVSIEDHRFYSHQGVDWVTTIKACARMFFGDDSVGGSSITQQLIKNLLLFEDETADDVTVQRKVLEIFRALQLEKRYHKDTIMEMYLNCIYLGQGCRGVRSAAETYFGKELELLTTAECASLISITNSPTYYDPYQNFDNNKERKEDVLWAMREYGWIDDATYQEAVAQELVLKVGVDEADRLASCENESCDYRGKVSTYKQEGSSYYCPQCGTLTPVSKNNSQNVYSYFGDTVLEDVAKAMAKQAGFQWNTSTREMMMNQIKRGGYSIYTTFDKNAQDKVDAIYEDLDQIPDTRGGQQLQSAIVIIDNRSGDIVAMAGGVGEKTVHDGWNYATDSWRPSGSSIKPLSVYAPAFESGAITPATVVKDLPLNYNNGPYPLNDTRTYSYARTIYRAVVRSVNAAAANTLYRSGESYAFKFAKEKFRLSTLTDAYTDDYGIFHTDIGVGPLAMGAQTHGVYVRDMASAFATFANEGVYRQGRTFTKVYDSNGNLIIDNTQETEQILSHKTVDYMNYCLTAATREGTGVEADLSSSYGVSTAGKTGTSGDNHDRWYCGFTGYYTAAVWCGFKDSEPIYCYGGVNNPAAHLFKKVMGPLHSGKSDILLYSSSKLQQVNICLSSGKIATEACTHDIRLDAPFDPDAFIATSMAAVYAEDMPKEYCDEHVMLDICSGGGVATQWCHNFAKVDSSVKFKRRGLVKLTQRDIDEMLRAAPYNLLDDYLRNDYVYLINSDGSDGVFRGLRNDLQQSANAPYKTCPIHTSGAWDRYVAQHPEAQQPDNTVTPDE